MSMRASIQSVRKLGLQYDAQKLWIQYGAALCLFGYLMLVQSYVNGALLVALSLLSVYLFKLSYRLPFLIALSSVAAIAIAAALPSRVLPSSTLSETAASILLYSLLLGALSLLFAANSNEQYTTLTQQTLRRSRRHTKPVPQATPSASTIATTQKSEPKPPNSTVTPKTTSKRPTKRPSAKKTHTKKRIKVQQNTNTTQTIKTRVRATSRPKPHLIQDIRPTSRPSSR